MNKYQELHNQLKLLALALPQHTDVWMSLLELLKEAQSESRIEKEKVFVDLINGKPMYYHFFKKNEDSVFFKLQREEMQKLEIPPDQTVMEFGNGFHK
jgi:TFIIF-interacting CTD phosphatase-like protein